MAVAKKPAAKKATKPAAKKTTAKTAKPAAKKTTAKAAPKKAVANEITVTGQKKVGTLMIEFNEKFPYMGLRLYRPEAKNADSFTKFRIPQDKTLASVRAENASGGTISIYGNKKIKNLEKEFDTVFGLYAQVCYCPKGCKPGHGYVTTEDEDEYTLSAFNEKCQKEGSNPYSYGK